jgi:hypothetical protein
VDLDRDAVQATTPVAEADRARAMVVGIGREGQVIEAFEIAKQIVDALLGDPHVGSHLARAAPVGARPAEQGDVRWPQVVEPVGDDAFVDTTANLVEGEAKERADRHRRPVVSVGGS